MLGMHLHVLLLIFCTLCHTVCKVRFPGAMGRPGGILDCLRGRIRNQTVCSVRPVVFPGKTFPPWGRAEPAEGQQFTTSRADTEHPASWMLAAAKPQPWRPNMGLEELSGPPMSPTASLSP